MKNIKPDVDLNIINGCQYIIVFFSIKGNNSIYIDHRFCFQSKGNNSIYHKLGYFT